MPAITVDTTGDHEAIGRKAGIGTRPVIHTTADWTIDPIEHGMQSGATSLMVLIPAFVDGNIVLVAAETSLNCWMMATAILRAKFEDEVNRPGWAVLSPQARAMLLPRYAEAICRAIPAATQDQAIEAAGMMLDAFGSGDGQEPSP